MKIYKNIRGTMKEVPEVEVNVDTVYIRTNIKKVEEEDLKGWEYDEVQYKKDQFIETLSEKNKELEEDNVGLLMELAINELRLDATEEVVSNLILKIAKLEGGLI